MTNYHVVPAGQGTNYRWERDNIFVKVAGTQTGGAFSMVEDNLKAEFALGLHEHRTHSETFYILDGSLKFYMDDRWFTAEKGATVHIPAAVPHAVKMAGGPGQSLMIFQPSFFEDYLAELIKLTPQQFADARFRNSFPSVMIFSRSAAFRRNEGFAWDGWTATSRLSPAAPGGSGGTIRGCWPRPARV
ncbi:MAG: cupin domain-containing protein, partial [Pseudolabrys sp.]|nr:cupin domain-containing protein [Pseudolabrys sp.]